MHFHTEIENLCKSDKFAEIMSALNNSEIKKLFRIKTAEI